MKEYSDRIFDELMEIDRKISSMVIEDDLSTMIMSIERVLTTNDTCELDEILKNVNDKKLISAINLKKIALKINNENFEQMKEALVFLNEQLNILKSRQNTRIMNLEMINKFQNKQKILEYVYNLGLPIDDLKQIKEIIKLCQTYNEDALEILKIVVDENIRIYTLSSKKEKYLTSDKMDKLNIDKDTQALVDSIKTILALNNGQSDYSNVLNYLLSVSDNELEATIKNDVSFDDTVILGLMRNILDNFNNNIVNEKMIRMLYILYGLYNDKLLGQIEKQQIKPVKKLIFLSKSTNNSLYITDNIARIENKTFLNTLKRQFLELLSGDVHGKPLTELPELLIEKKNYKLRLTYKVLPNDYVLVLNCYVKGNKMLENVKELFKKKAVFVQLHLYEALATEDPDIISQAIQKIIHKKEVDRRTIENYIWNFVNADKIDILKFFEGDKKCLKN